MKTTQLLIAVSIVSLPGLTSCGGGGDGGPTFPATPANLTDGNAATFARFVDLAARGGATMRLGESLNPTGPSTFTDPGCLAQGSNPAIVALNAASGPVNGTATYSSFDRCFGMRANGAANLTGTMAPGNLVDLMNFSFGNLTFTTGTQTIQASGTALLDWTTPASTYAMTLNATASGAASFRLESFRIDGQSAGAGLENVSLSGRLTTSDGFVDIATGPTPPQLAIPSNGLQGGGQITMTGATTRATVTYNGSGSMIIVLGPR